MQIQLTKQKIIKNEISFKCAKTKIFEKNFDNNVFHDKLIKQF